MPENAQYIKTPVYVISSHPLNSQVNKGGFSWGRGMLEMKPRATCLWQVPFH